MDSMVIQKTLSQKVKVVLDIGKQMEREALDVRLVQISVIIYSNNAVSSFNF